MPASPTPPSISPSTSPSTGATTNLSARAAPVRWHWSSALAGALIAAIVLGGFVFVWRRPTPAPIAIHTPPALVAPTPAPIESPTPAPVVIFISGAVQEPGVYELPAGARVVDALARAGGFAPSANINAVNQAAPLGDGDQIYVPTLEEEATEPPVGISTVAAPTAASSTAGAQGNGLINVNTASLEELISLPGIGETRAQDIIANRPYVSVDDLDRVPGIGPATLEDLRPLVVVE